MRAYRIAYDGPAYRGYQRQPHGDTVANQLLRALATLDIVPDAETTPEGYAAAGRTDAGVSALAQTVAFDAPDWCSPRALNGALPETVRAWAATSVRDDFHATHDATARTYEYDLHAPAADHDLAVEALDRLSGSHDVTNLTADDRGTERTIEATLVEVDADRQAHPSAECSPPSDAHDTGSSILRLRFTAGGFPRQFVRRAAELVRRVAVRERTLDHVDRVLDPKPLPGHEGIPPAPPEPLVLVDVTYPDVSFSIDETAAQNARSAFERRRIDRLVRSRVAGHIRDGIGD